MLFAHVVMIQVFILFLLRCSHVLKPLKVCKLFGEQTNMMMRV